MKERKEKKSNSNLCFIHKNHHTYNHTISHRRREKVKESERERDELCEFNGKIHAIFLRFISSDLWELELRECFVISF